MLGLVGCGSLPQAKNSQATEPFLFPPTLSRGAAEALAYGLQGRQIDKVSKNLLGIFVRRNLPLVLSAIYLLLSIGAYVAVLSEPPDGLANLPLVIVNLPSIILERLFCYMIYGSMSGYLWEPLVRAVGLPSGYALDQVFWFVPLTILQTYFVFRFVKWMRRESL